MSREREAIETLFYIQNKEGSKVPFKFTNAQAFLDNKDNPNGRTRIIVAKARQKGFTSSIAGKFGIRCLGKEGTHAAIVSHESNATQRILDRIDYYLKTMEGPRPVFGRHSRMEMYFEKTESSLYIGTAGAKAFGRGDTITDLHCSEYAWWEDPVKHSAGLFQAVPHSGRIYIESTGNGRNNDFYYIWEHAEDMGYTRLFYPWFADLEYALELPKDKSSWKPDTSRYNPYLLEIKAKHKLSDKQMYWYENKLRELREDLALMQQEYPSDPEECFQATGGAIFNNVDLTISPLWQTDNFEGFYISRLMDHPKKGFTYVIGADPSGGTGGDDAAFNIFCAETQEQVFEFFNNRANPIVFGELVCKAGVRYNDAFIIPESNNHGAAVVPYLKENYKKAKIYKRSFGTKTTEPIYGWNNTQTTKHAIVGVAQEMISDITFHGMQTVKELKAFEEDREGKMGAKSDNLTIATCLAILGLKKFEYLRKEFIKPKEEVKKHEKVNYMTYTLEDVLSRIKTNKSKSIAQVGRGYPN
jgi:hypothetical protein